MAPIVLDSAFTRMVWSNRTITMAPIHDTLFWPQCCHCGCCWLLLGICCPTASSIHLATTTASWPFCSFLFHLDTMDAVDLELAAQSESGQIPLDSTTPSSIGVSVAVRYPCCFAHRQSDSSRSFSFPEATTV